MMRRKPELLVPAGDMEKLKMAVLYGADAVYLAGTAFGMRAFAGNFTPEELPRAVRYAHDHGVAVHATVNTMPRWGEADQLPAYLEQLDDAGVDALILADLGAFTLAGKYAPHCQRHISTQQSVANHICAHGAGALIYSFHRIQSVMATNRTPRKPKLMAENSTMNRPVCPLTCFVYSRKVIRLASDATSVPAPPIFTPTSSPR